jgi:hypothetical protein
MKYKPEYGEAFNNDLRKVNSLIVNIKKLLNPLFIIYSDSTFYYQLHREQDNVLLLRLLTTAKEHFVTIYLN